MTYQSSQPIRGKGTGDPSRIATWASERGTPHPDRVDEYLDTLYALSDQYGLNADVLVAQSILETSRNGIPWNSYWWTARTNPAGIGITGDPAQNDLSKNFLTGEEAARAHVAHMALYAGIPIPEGLAAADPRWQAALDAGYAGSTTTLNDLTNRWAVDKEYATKIAGWLNNLDEAGLIGPADEDDGGSMAIPHNYIISMGHHNTNRGGASGEFAWVDDGARAIKKEILKRGGKAWIIQEEDGDGNPDDYTRGGLQQAAQACVTLANRLGPFKAYLSIHYDSTPGFHAIFPNSPTGGIDIKANNPLDVRLCRNIRDAMRATNTVPMKSWTADSPGVMSETETNVGAKGSRLGEFYGTVGFRTTTARTIIEASGYGDPYLKDPNWLPVFAGAVVDGLEATFGKMGGITPPVEEPEPPVDEKPDDPTTWNYPNPVVIPELASGAAYHKTGGGDQIVRVDHKLRALRTTPRYRYAEASHPDRVGPDLVVDPTATNPIVVDVSHMVIKQNGELWWISDQWTRFKYDDFVIYDADVDDAPQAVDG